MYKLKVTFDTSTEVDSNLLFEYLPDPIITSTEPAELKSISSGGTTFKVIGEGFIAIDNLTVGFVDSEGKNLTTETEKKDYVVFVGPGYCTITSLTETELVCRPPTKEPTTRLTEDKLFIRVKVGNIEQTVGIIEYIDQPPTLEYHSRRAPCAVNCHCHCVCCCNGTQTTSSKKDENCEHYESDTRP